MNKVLPLLAALALGLPSATHALLFTQPLDFDASTQSLWGPGGSTADFGASGSAGLGPVTFGYDIGASSGTVSAGFQGDMSVDYSPFLIIPGTTSLNLSFQGDADAGQLKSDLGAWANVWGEIDFSLLDLDFDILDEDYVLNIDKSYTPQLDQQVSGSDSFTAADVGLDVKVAEVGAVFNIEQTDKFTAIAIDGILAYTLRGSVTTSLTPFSLDTDAGLALDLGLSEVGIWDFWFLDIMLDNLFFTSFDAELLLYENHRGCGFLGLEWCGRNELPLADLDVYDGSPFPLAFNSITDTNGFSIQVGRSQVPEPSILALLSLGLAGLGFTRRRKV